MRALTKLLTVCLLLAVGSIHAQPSAKQNKRQEVSQQSKEKAKGDSEKGNNANEKSDQAKAKVDKKADDSWDGKTGATDKDWEDNKAKEKPEKASKGNAYGKEKGDIPGRDFGQMRADEAKALAEEKRSQVAEKQQELEKELELRKEKLKEARQKVEQQKKEGKLSKEEIAQKEAALDRVAERLAELETLVKSKNKATSVDEN